MAEASIQPASGLPADADGGEVRDFIALLKPRVMSLVVFSGLVGLALAPGPIHPVLGCCRRSVHRDWALALLAPLTCGTTPTSTRSCPARRSGLSRRVRFQPGSRIGVRLYFVSRLCRPDGAGFELAGCRRLLAFTILFYVGIVYTMWLKRRTPQNIVIGGAAGAFPPMIGWAAVTGDIASGARGVVR